MQMQTCGESIVFKQFRNVARKQVKRDKHLKQTASRTHLPAGLLTVSLPSDFRVSYAAHGEVGGGGAFLSLPAPGDEPPPVPR